MMVVESGRTQRPELEAALELIRGSPESDADVEQGVRAAAFRLRRLQLLRRLLRAPERAAAVQPPAPQG
ncbi:MAG: hypothetical protein WDN04_06530 [Rhodospirillales bacterium]